MSSQEETQNYFIGTIKSLQTQLEEERKTYENEKKNYENKINELRKQISDINNNTKEENIKNLEKEKEKLEKENKDLDYEIKKLQDENKKLNNLYEYENNKNKELLKEKKDLISDYERILKQKEEDKNGIINQFKNYQQKKEMEKEEYEKKIEKLENTQKKEKEENENNIKNLEEDIIKLKKKNKELIDYIKSEKEKKDSEIEKEINISSNTEKNNDETPKNINNNLNSIDEKKLKIFSELLCEFLLYLNNSKFNLSIFEMISQSISKFDELNFFSQLDINSLENFNNNNFIEDNLFKFFLDFKSYILIYGEKSTLNNFLNQNVFKYKNISNNDIEIIEKISNLKICNNIDIKNEYESKKETYYKTINLSFDLLKTKIISSKNNKIKLNDIPLILKTKEMINEFNINFNDINIYKFNYLLNFQYKNLFKNIEKISIKITETNLPLLFNILIYCENLKYFSLEIIESPDSKHKKNNNNIVFQQILPFIIKPNLLGIEIKNLNLNDNIESFTNSLQNSKIETLSLINTNLNKQNLTNFSQYFKNNLNLKKLNLSYLPNINLISILNDSLFLSSNKLEELILINNNFNNEDIEILCKYLENHSINYLNLSKNKLNQLSCSYLGVYFSKNENLLNLNLSDCNLNEENFQLVFKKDCLKKLKYLNLDNNKLSDSGLITLGNFILKCLSIEEISLCNCSIGEKGMILFINFLINKKNIKLYLLKNVINENILKEIEKNKNFLIENNIKIYCSKESNLKENEIIIIQ